MTYPAPLPAPVAVPVREAARLLSCSRAHVYRLVRRGELLKVKDGRLSRILSSSLTKYLTRHTRKPHFPAG